MRTLKFVSLSLLLPTLFRDTSFVAETKHAQYCRTETATRSE